MTGLSSAGSPTAPRCGRCGPRTRGRFGYPGNFPSGLEAAAGCIECLSGAASVLARRASQERRMTSPTAGRIGYAGAHTDHVNPDRAGNKSATFRNGLSPVPAPTRATQRPRMVPALQPMIGRKHMFL